jgi:hypothetical protein
MAQPYNYSLNIPSPMQAFGQAFNVGAAGQRARSAREDREAAIAQREAERLAVESFFEKPLEQRTSEDYLRLGMINPQIAELAQSQFDALSAERQQVAFRDATQIHTALRNSLAGETDPEIVDQIFASRVEATRNDPGLNKMWVDARELAKLDPEGAEAMVGTRIATLPGGKDYFATMKTRGEEARSAQLQPGKIKENKLQVEKLQDEIKFNQYEGFINLAENGVDVVSMVAAEAPIRKDLQEISKRQKQLNAAQRRKDQATITNLEQQIQERQDAVQEKAQAKIQEQRVQMLASEDLLRKSTEILDAALEKDARGNYKKDEEGNYIVNATARAALGPIDQILFTAQPEVADFEEDVGVLAAQIYLDKIKLMRGTGPLSDREGAKLESAAESLSLRQSPQKFITNVMSIRDLSQRNQELTKQKYGDFGAILEERAAGQTGDTVTTDTVIEVDF